MRPLSAAHEAFGSEIRRVRKELGWTQEELGHRAGLHPTYIGDVERGERNVSLENILNIATSLEVTGSSLVAAADDEYE